MPTLTPCWLLVVYLGSLAGGRYALAGDSEAARVARQSGMGQRKCDFPTAGDSVIVRKYIVS